MNNIVINSNAIAIACALLCLSTLGLTFLLWKLLRATLDDIERTMLALKELYAKINILTKSVKDTFQ
jgi:hypothetical protein